MMERVETLAARLALALLRLLTPSAASNLGGALGRLIGPLLPVSRVADENLRRAMPELDAAARRRITRDVWDNLGRTVAELPHVGGLRRTEAGPGWEIAPEADAVARDLAAKGGPAIFISAHFGNWEIWPNAAACYGIKLGVVYRPAANRGVDAMLTRLRIAAGAAALFAKGAAGARGAIGHLARGGTLALLVDQKMNDGIPVPFFGRDAMTAPAVAAFALRYRCPIIPACAIRLGPARFRIVIDPPIELPDGPDRTANIAAVMRDVNACVERWVRAHPGMWLWLHRRWPKQS